MDPSQVRTRILTDHANLRRLLDALEQTVQVIQRAQKVSAEAIRPLRDGLLHLGRELEQHLDLEDGLLVPTLHGIDAWGPVRAEQVSEDHTRQRATLRELEETCTVLGNDVSGLVSLAKDFVKDLRDDMASEEKDVLSPKLLRDDPITLDQTGG